MSDLQEVYSLIEGLERRGCPVPQQLRNEALELETALLSGELVEAVRQHVSPILGRLRSEVVLVVSHKPGEAEPTVGVVRQPDAEAVVGKAVVVWPLPEKGLDPTVVEDKRGREDKDPVHRSKSIGFAVHFEDGLVVDERDAKYTFIKALQHMSLPRVSAFSDRTFAGFPLVGKKQRVTEDGHKWQEKVQGWWIYVNMSNETKMAMLEQVADFLGYELRIELKYEAVK
jgi:hypothetical protein